MENDPALVFGRFVLSPSKRELLIDGVPVAVGERALDLLHALIRRRDRTVSKAELLDVVWPGAFVEEGNLYVQVSALRKVLGERVIVTVPGRGYRFVAPLLEPAAAPAFERMHPRDISELPAEPPPLIGREDALVLLSEWVLEHPLVTVTGAGGIGKTRLALAVAITHRSRWPDGVAWIECSAVREGGQLAQAVAQATRVALGNARSAEQLASELRGRSMLLFLDNCEHLLDATGALVSTLRRLTPEVHLLVTSQQALRTSGERVFQVSPLAVPGTHDVPDESFGAIRLFAERARAIDRRFRIDASNRATVGDICRQLDGLPLAIELAAARVKLLGVKGLHERLDDRLRLLTGGIRDAAPRHQTLRAALEWSHGLLSCAEQTVLRRLGVFIGGFTLELAQDVARDAGGSELDEWAVLEAVSALVDKSLISVELGEPVRYRLLETIRLFALEQLDAAGESSSRRTRHSHAVSDLFASVDESRWGDHATATASEVTQRLRPEIDNARAALEWSMHIGDAPTAISLAGAAASLYVQLGLTSELVPILQTLRARLEEAPASAQVNVLWRLGTLGVQAGMRQDELLFIKMEAVAKARAAGFRRRLQVTLAALGFTRARQGELNAAQAIHAELLGLERPNDPAYLRGLRLTVEMMIHEHRNNIEQAVVCLRKQREVLRSAPDEVLPLMTCESNLVMYLDILGRFEEAAELGATIVARPDLPRTFIFAICWTAYALAALGRLDQALLMMRSRRREIAASPIGVYSAESLAMLCLAGGRLHDAVAIDAAARLQENLARKMPHPLTQAFRARLDNEIARADVGPADLARWRSVGESLSDEAAVELALG
ncbi:winged helix-turn-helix domain-containing protein [Rhizobacter sp. Root404]|uniref:ATP-binding protein n=1 Tax=Rhizobacter sp. Root404 TaxID=1736528 RepID=UPI000AD6F586|nr:winged helix-turn-helix domain-containing protein [Rhizobacter sp. Root404]